MTQITEVRKGWRSDPIDEDGFVDLMSYDPSRDILKPTSALGNGRSHLLKTIAQKWSTKPCDVLKNLDLRAKIQGELVAASSKLKKPDLLEAEFVVQSNLTFHRLLEEELGHKRVRCGRVFERWREWLEGAA